MALLRAPCGSSVAGVVSRGGVAGSNGRITSSVIEGVMSPCACLGWESALVGGRNVLMGSLARGMWRPSYRGICLIPRRRGGMVVVARTGGSGVGQPYRPPRPSTGPRRGSYHQQDPEKGDGPLMNTDIRVPLVRLLDEDQTMVGVVSTLEALQRSREADLDLVMISPDADPPVVRIMNYSKYKYGLQKKKREAQKKAAANRQVLKELKMRYNIDTHDYDVRQRAAQRFLKDGDKVKVVCQFKGREMDFKDLAAKLFNRFQEEIGPLATLETKISLEGKTMFMVLAPNKTAMLKAQATAQSEASKAKARAGEKSDNVAAVEPAKTLEAAMLKAQAGASKGKAQAGANTETTAVDKTAKTLESQASV